MTTLRFSCNGVRTCLAAYFALQLAGCAGPYSLPPSVTTAVGEQPRLQCSAGEVQLCVDHGSALRCTCSSPPF